MNHKQVTQHPRQHCYFCGSEGPIETHHIVPRRHGGSDDEVNLVDVCPTCHQRLERLYDKRFFKMVGVDTEDVVETADSEPEDDCDRLKQLIAEIEDEFKRGAPIEVVRDRAVTQDYIEDRDNCDEIIEKIHRKGELYRPTSGHLRTT